MQNLIVVVLVLAVGFVVWKVVKSANKQTTTSSNADNTSVATPLPKGTFQKPRKEDEV